MLYLIRHGTTDQPMLRLPGDQRPVTREEWELDHGLSEKGQREALALRERLARLSPPDRLIASPRRRARDTAALAVPGRTAVIEDLLHEWHGDETDLELHARVMRLLVSCEEGTTWAFTHGGFIRAVLAGLIAKEDSARFGPTYHGLRRALHIWNCSITVIGHGGSGLEVLGVNLHGEIEEICGRPAGV